MTEGRDWWNDPDELHTKQNGPVYKDKLLTPKYTNFERATAFYYKKLQATACDCWAGDAQRMEISLPSDDVSDSAELHSLLREILRPREATNLFRGAI